MRTIGCLFQPRPPPYVSEAFGSASASAKYSKWNESADDTNLGGIMNSLDILEMQFDLDK